MRVSGLNSEGDWRFGKGRAAYKRNSEAIAQNVMTRLRSFTDDWFLNVDHGVNWIELFGDRNNERRILRAIERTVLTTEGVRAIEKLAITSRGKDRRITVNLSYVDLFDTRFTESLELP